MRCVCILAFVVAVSASVPCQAAGKPLPPKDALDAAKQLVAETYRKELSAADKSPAIKAMLDLAGQTEGDAPAQAALYLGAAEVAARAGETKLAFDAVDQLAAVFDVDALATKATLLDVSAKAAKTNDARVSVANRGLELADAAMSAGRMDIGESALKTAGIAAAKVRDAVLRKDIAAKRKELERERKHAERAESELASAKKALNANPDDPEANETLGKYLAFDRNDWPAGLKHLAKSADQSLQALAVADARGATTGAKAAVLGDSWYAMADAADSERDRAGFKSRAVFWYTRAVADLKGFSKARIEKRFSEMQDALAAAANQTGGENGRFIDVTLAPGVLLRLVKIPASSDGKVKEFYLGQTEVTQKQWQAVMGSNPSPTSDPQLPVVNIGEAQSVEFTGKLNSLPSGSRLSFRMPTTGEWIHAFCCGETLSEMSDQPTERGWVIQNAQGKAHHVGEKPANKWGLCDMLGNVWETTSEPHVIIGCAVETPCSSQDFKADFKSSTALYRNTWSGEPGQSIGIRIAADLR